MGRYEEAIPILKRTCRSISQQPMGHIGLIVAYTELGRDEDARAEAAEIMRISPGFSLVPPERDLSKDVA